MEYLKKIRKALDELRGKSGSELPDKLRTRDDAKAYYGALLEPMTRYDLQGHPLDEFVADMAIRIEDIVNSHKIRDWTCSRDVKNHMINDIEDYFYSLKGRYELDIDFGIIEAMINQLIAIAERRDS